MKRKVCKRLLAGLLSGTMVLGMSVTAFAADPAGSGSTTGDGKLEGHVDKSKLEVTLPTTGDTTTFKYTIDPEGLIAATQAAKYPGTTYDSSTGVYFLTSGTNYTDKSAKLKVTNKGSVDADVTVTVSVADPGSITLKDKAQFTEAGGQELYLGLLVADKDPVSVTATGDTGAAKKTVGLKGSPDNFEVKYDQPNDKYEYAAKDGVADTAWNSFEFGIEGACNTKGDYSASGFAVPTVSVTWSYDKRADDSTNDLLDVNATEDADPSIATTGTYNKTTGVITATVNLGAGSGATTLASAKYGSSVEKATSDVISPSVSGTTFTGSVSDAVKSAFANYSGEFYVVITLADGKTQAVSLTLTE